jgi:hypothetical protein
MANKGLSGDERVILQCMGNMNMLVDKGKDHLLEKIKVARKGNN